MTPAQDVEHHGPLAFLERIAPMAVENVIPIHQIKEDFSTLICSEELFVSNVLLPIRLSLIGGGLISFEEHSGFPAVELVASRLPQKPLGPSYLRYRPGAVAASSASVVVGA